MLTPQLRGGEGGTNKAALAQGGMTLLAPAAGCAGKGSAIPAAIFPAHLRECLGCPRVASLGLGSRPPGWGEAGMVWTEPRKAA